MNEMETNSNNHVPMDGNANPIVSSDGNLLNHTERTIHPLAPSRSKFVYRAGIW